MIAWRKRSLRSRLIIRLVPVQGIAVLLTAILGIGATVLMYDIGRSIANPADADIVAEAIDWDAQGNLVLRPTDDLETLQSEAPNIWFVVSSERGETLSYGDMPDLYVSIADNIRGMAGSSLSGYGANHELDAFIRVYEDRPGRLHIMVGQGRLINVLPAVLQMINRYLFALFAVLAIATTALIPWIIRREVRAVEEVAAKANTIDIDHRGMQLPTDRLPSEIQPLVQAFNATLKRIDKSYLRQQRFLAAAAHELKTPIAILQTRIETSIDGPERHQLLLDVARLTNLAEQLLDVQRIEHAPDDDAATDLVALARNVVADVAPLAIAAGYEIVFESVPASYMVHADHGAIERVVTNLIQNAMIHGGGRGEIGVIIDAEGRLSVHDQGPGVPDPHKEDIFEPFHRVTPSNRGSGLGLSLVSDVIRLHQGHVSVKDRLAGGAIFTVTLPRHLRDPEK